MWGRHSGISHSKKKGTAAKRLPSSHRTLNPKRLKNPENRGDCGYNRRDDLRDGSDPTKGPSHIFGHWRNTSFLSKLEETAPYRLSLLLYHSNPL